MQQEEGDRKGRTGKKEFLEGQISLNMRIMSGQRKKREKT